MSLLCPDVRRFFCCRVFAGAEVVFVPVIFKERFVQYFFRAEKNTVAFAAACDGLCGLCKITLGDWDGVESVYTFLGDWWCFLSFFSLLFFASPKKSNKRKATLFQMLRRNKEALRCVRKATITCMALAFNPAR